MLLPLVLSLSVLIVSAEEVITLHARAKPSFQSTKGVFDFAHGQQAALAALVKFKPNFVVPNSTIIPKINSIPAPVKSVLGLKKRSSGALGQQPLLNYGPDILYYGGISVGSPVQNILINPDTGSSDLWLGSLCVDCFGGAATFNPLLSSTYKPSAKPFQITYGAGSAYGFVASDVVTIAGYKVANQSFGSVNVVSKEFARNFPADGILGLGFKSLSTSGAVPFVQRLIAARALPNNLFAFYLNRTPSPSSIGSVLTIGGVDSTRFTGLTTYHSVIKQGYWEIAASSTVVNGKTRGGSFTAAIDTGTSFIYLPTAAAQSLWAAVPGASVYKSAGLAGNGVLYQYPCNSAATVALAFPDQSGTPISYVIASADLNLGTISSGSSMCVGAVQGLDFKGNLAIVGDSFLKNWYSVYTFDGTGNGVPAVGFAKAI